MNADEIIERLGLVPHLGEGGWFRETYRSPESVESHALPARYRGDRSFGSAIFYLLAPGNCSVLHRLKSDEVWHFYLGDPVEMLLLGAGSGEILTLGHGLEEGMRLQLAVPRGTWQGCRLRDGGRFALMGTTVSPGYDPGDFEAGSKEALLSEYPAFSEWIMRLTERGGGA